MKEPLAFRELIPLRKGDTTRFRYSGFSIVKRADRRSVKIKVTDSFTAGSGTIFVIRSNIPNTEEFSLARNETHENPGYYDSGSSLGEPVVHFQYPAEMGDNWEYLATEDGKATRVEVVEKDQDYTVQGKNYSKCIRYLETGDSNPKHYIIKPGLGLIIYSLGVYGGGEDELERWERLP